MTVEYGIERTWHVLGREVTERVQKWEDRRGDSLTWGRGD